MNYSAIVGSCSETCYLLSEKPKVLRCFAGCVADVQYSAEKCRIVQVPVTLSGYPARFCRAPERFQSGPQRFQSGPQSATMVPYRSAEDPQRGAEVRQ